jgi:hypothetical protein
MLPTSAGVAAGTAWAGAPGNVAARRYYAASPGSVVDVTLGDETTLDEQGFFQVGNASGTTAQRPNFAANQTPLSNVGFMYVDTTIPKVVVWDGANWRDPITGSTA